MSALTRHFWIPTLGLLLLVVLALAQVVNARPADAGQASPNYLLMTPSAPADNPYAGDTSMPTGQVATRNTNVLFIENAGQFDAAVLYQVKGTHGAAWLTDNAIWFSLLGEPAEADQLSGVDHEPVPNLRVLESGTRQGVNLRLTLLGSNPGAALVPFDHLDTMVNYVPKDRPETIESAQLAWGGVRYEDIYPGVDLVIEAAPLSSPGSPATGRPMRWHFEADQPADLRNVRLHLEGAERVGLEGADLLVESATGKYLLSLPVSVGDLAVDVTTLVGEKFTISVTPSAVDEAEAHEPAEKAEPVFEVLFEQEKGEEERSGNYDPHIDLPSANFPTLPGPFSLQLAPIDREPASGPVESSLTALPNIPAAFTRGDLLIGFENGYQIQWRRSDGSLVRTIQTTAGDSTGMFVHRTNNRLYVTTFNSGSVSVYSNEGNYLGTFGSNYYYDPESIIFDAAGNAYVGQADGYRDILKFNPSGTYLARFDVATESRGSDWIDLGADQCTLYYTSEGYLIKRYNVCTNTQLTNYATSPHAYLFALRLMPGGGLLAANWSDIHRFNSAGQIVKTYDASGRNDWFALNIAPNGTSFWSAGYYSGTVHKFDINSAAQIVSFDASNTYGVAGLGVVGEVTVQYVPSVVAPIDVPQRNGTVTGNVTIRGYAIDRNSSTGTGIDQVHIYLDGPYGTGRIIGAAQYGLSRPDVGNYYGNPRFTPSGWQLFWNTANVTAGAHSLYLYAHRTTDNGWSRFGPHNITVLGTPTPTPTITPTPTYAPNVIAPIETPVDGGAVAGSVTLSGYAIDRNSRSGTGIDTVHLYLDGPYGIGTFLGQAEYGLNRPDIGTRYGNVRFNPSGWRLVWNVGNLNYGTHRLYLYARRSTDGQWAMRGPHNVVVQAPTPTPPCQRYEPNNTLATATGPLANGQTMEAALCSGDPDDFYYIDLSAGATLTLDLTNLPAGTDFDLFLYNAGGGNPIAQSRNTGTVPERIVKTITAGRYYIRVYPYTGRSQQVYRLRVVWSNALAGQEPDTPRWDKPPVATPVGQ